MERDDYERVRELFHELHGRPAGEVRRALGERGVAPAIRAEVEALLGHESKHSPFEEQRLGKVASRILAASAAEGEGREEHAQPAAPLPDEIAGFRILGLLGRGGMGIVYRGLQERPRRDVAIKVLQAIGSDASSLRRFEYEAEILARLDHPYVAQVIQAGVDRVHDVPYIAMELVQGHDLLTWCDERALGLDERLQLFARVCEGVEHAHQHGIVHRDLKPANILVSADGRPRILDFGIARPVTEADVSTPGRTEAGSLLGSLAWMSPEQAHGDLTRLDVRSDVYSLGVLLYRLLTGEMPYELVGLAPWEAARRIWDHEPRRLGSHRRELRGDLEAIVAMALDKDPARRYPSAGALARDLQRFRDLQPVEARPWSGAYQLRKFARRHRLLVSTAGLLVASVLVGLVTAFALWRQAEAARRLAGEEAQRAQRKAETSQRIVAFLRGMFDEASTFQVSGEHVTVKQVLDRAVPEIESELLDEPLVRAELLMTMGGVYSNLGLYPEASPLLEAAHATLRASDAAEPDMRLEAAFLLARLEWSRGRYAESLALYAELVPELVRTQGMESASTLRAIWGRANLLVDLGRYDEAEKELLPAIAVARRAFPGQLRPTLNLVSSLTVLYLDQERFDEAEPLAREVYEGRKAELGEGHYLTAAAGNSLASVYMERRRFDRAEAVFGETLDAMRASLTSRHPYTLTVERNFGNLYLRMGRLASAEPLLREAYETQAEVLGPAHPDTLTTQTLLALLLERQGKPDEALGLYQEVLEAQEDTLGPHHRDVVQTMTDMAHAQLARDPELALLLLQEAVERGRQGSGLSDPRTLKALVGRVELLRARAGWEEIDALLPEALAACRAARGDADHHTLEVQELLVRCLLDQGRKDEAQGLAQSLLEATAEGAPERPARRALLERAQA